MIAALTILLLFQLAGEVLVQLSGLPVPGPVIGMVLLFLALALRGSVSEDLRNTSQTLLSHLSLLFVPAGVGVPHVAHRPEASAPPAGERGAGQRARPPGDRTVPAA